LVTLQKKTAKIICVSVLTTTAGCKNGPKNQSCGHGNKTKNNVLTVSVLFIQRSKFSFAIYDTPCTQQQEQAVLLVLSKARLVSMQE